jgi:hypothetical protein
MHLTRVIFSLLGLAPLATVASSLKPWEISRLTTFSPSGRPGSSPWSIINITISDPNDAISSPTICSGKWTFEEPPYDIINSCSEVPGAEWTFVMLRSNGTGASPTMDFQLRFELNKKRESFEGTEKFVVGENMSGLCSASGVCSFGLKEEMTPFPIKQVRVR